MPVPEPGGELWPLVRSQSGWPQTDEDGIRAMAAGWRGQGDGFIQAGGFQLGDLETAWPDLAGVAYRARAGEHLRTAARTGSEMMELGRRADAFAGEVTAVKSAITDLIARNEPYYGRVDPAFRGGFVTRVAEMVNGLMQDGAARITGAGGAPLGRAEAPAPGTDPAAVRTWWETLPTPAQDALIRENPDAIRNLDGIPAEVRDVTNRAVLGREIAALEAERDEIRARPLLQQQGAGLQLSSLDERIRALEYLRDDVGTAETGRRYLLGLDPSGDGQAIVAIGNPDTATNVATVVPGTTARLGSIHEDVGRAERLLGATAGGEGTTAVIAWVGYDAPDSIDAASSASANGGEEALARFQDGLRASHDAGTAHQTVIAHSYGTVLAGQTARDLGLNADDLILVAGPGTGVNTVDELTLTGVPPEQIGDHVHAITSPDDWIRRTHLDEPNADIFIGHGLDPTHPEYGAHVLDGDNGSRDEHNGYFDEGTVSISQLGGIIAPPRPG